MMGHFLDQFGLVLVAAPIMPTGYFPVNFYQMLKRQTHKSLNEFMDKRKQTGRYGEELAALYLQQKGYKIVERNWRCPTGELDVIAEDGPVLVFVEVRTRHGSYFGRAEESITPAKQTRLIELGQTYLQEKAIPLQPWRIDVVAIQIEDGQPSLTHFENAVGW